MALPAFPDIPIGRESKPGVEHNVETIDYGDGYQQVAEVGINAIRQIWDVVFDNISLADYETIRAFLEDKAVNAFTWTPPTEVSDRNWKIVNGTFDPSFPKPNSAVLRVRFRESFDLV